MTKLASERRQDHVVATLNQHAYLVSDYGCICACGHTTHTPEEMVDHLAGRILADLQEHDQ